MRFRCGSCDQADSFLTGRMVHHDWCRKSRAPVTAWIRVGEGDQPVTQLTLSLTDDEL